MTIINAKMEARIYTARGHAKVMRFVNRNRMEFVRDNLLHTHFERNELTAPGGGYGYKPPTKKYAKFKARRAKHQIPLVLTGRLKREIKANSRITATQHVGRLRARGYFPMPFEMRRMIEVMTPGQQKLLASGAKALYTQAASLPEFHDLIRVRG